MSGWFVLLSGWRRFIAAFVAGAFSAFAMAPFHLFPVLFLTFPILVWLVDGATSEKATWAGSRSLKAFKTGFAFGFGYFLSGLWWIGAAFLVDAEAFAWAMPIAILGLPVVLAIFWGLALAFASWLWRGNLRRIMVLASAFALAEFVRGHFATGLPWNTISYAALVSPAMMQSAALLGIYGLVAPVVFVFSAPALFAPGKSHNSNAVRYGLILTVVLVSAHFGYGTYRLHFVSQPANEETGIAVRLVQPSIPQNEKFDVGRHGAHLRRYLDLSAGGNDGATGLSEVRLLFWPESVFPYFLTENKQTLATIAAMLPDGTSLVTGAARSEPEAGRNGEPLVFNSIYVVNDQGLIESATDKIHLVPFGEYLPFQSFLESLGFNQLTKLQGGFASGASRETLAFSPDNRFLALVCYEIIFSGSIWNQQPRPEFIANLTNDAWFGNTPGPYQHEHQAIVRAVEQGLPLVRVANNGISGIYDMFGRARIRSKLNEIIVLDGVIPPAGSETLFSRFGWQIYLIVTGIFLGMGALPSHRTNRKKGVRIDQN